MTTANTCRDMQRRIPAKGPAFRHRRLTHEAARTVTTQAGNLADQRRNDRPVHAAEGFRDRLTTRMAVAFFTRENARDGLDPALDGDARRNRHTPHSGTGRNRCKGAFSATPSRSGGKVGALQMGRKWVSRLGAGVAANVRRPFPKILLVSRSRERRNGTRRPLISLGYAQLKPGPGRPATAAFDDFPL